MLIISKTQKPQVMCLTTQFILDCTKVELITFVFLRHADCYFISDIISISKCVVYQQKWLEGHVALPPPPPPPITFRGQGIHRRFRCMTGKHLQTNMLNCAIQISLHDANLPTHRPKYHH